MNRMLFKLYENNFRVLRKTVFSNHDRVKNPALKGKKWYISLKCELFFIFLMYWGFLQPENRMVMISGAKKIFLTHLHQEFSKNSFSETSWGRWVKKILLAPETCSNRFPGEKNPSISGKVNFALI